MILEHIANYARNPDLEGDLDYDETTGDPIGWTTKRGGPIKLWMPLDLNGKPPPVMYVLGEDTSLGRGATPSCLSAGRCDTGEKVLEYVTAFMPPDKFAIKCVAIARWLSSQGHRALMSWERGGPGDTFGTEVLKLQYYPIFYHVDTSKPQERQKATTPGVSYMIRPTMFTHYETDLAKAHFINRSERGLRDMFEWQNGPTGPVHNAYKVKNDPSGSKLNHGDLSISDAMCSMMMRLHGGERKAQAKDVILPGSLAHFMLEEERQKARGRSLYPNWNK